MGVTGKREEDELYIRKTPALNRFLFFLNDCVSQGKVDHEELAEIKCLMPHKEKHVIHLVLSACLDDKELQEICVENGEDVFSSIPQVLDPDEMERLSLELYVNLVVGLGLTEHSISMIMARPQLVIMRRVSEALTKKICEEKGVIDRRLFDIMLASFAQLSRMQGELFVGVYRKCLTDLLHNFVNSTETSSCEKLLTLIRLLGIALLCEEDYQNEDEISVLVSEWEVDRIIVLMGQSISLKYYESILGSICSELIQKRVDQHVLKTLDKSLAGIPMNLGDENLEKNMKIGSNEMSTSCYLGGCAYLIQMILEKRAKTIQADELPNVLKYIEDFVSKKPKMKQEEVVGEIRDFSHFCEEMKKYGNRDIYKRDWITKFLSFSVDHIIGTVEGNEIIDLFIMGADYDLVVECVKKIRTVEFFMLLNESKKELILRLLTHERASKKENEDFIKEFFQDGVNEKLQTETFDAEIHKITLQLSSIEFEKNDLQLAMYESAVIRICLQNPIKAVAKIFEQSIRTEHFRALGLARLFYHLPAGNDENQAEIGVVLPPTLIVRSFSKVLGYFPDYPNSVYESLCNNTELLIVQGILSKPDIVLVLKFQIFRHLKATNKVSLSVVVGMVSFLEHVVKLVSDKALINEIGLLVLNLNRFFCLYTNSKTFQDAMKIKCILCRILKFLNPVFLQANCDISKEKEDDIEDLSLFDQGILYVRCEQFRTLIKKSFETDICDLSFREFIQTCVLPWVLNCCDEEWSVLIDLIFNVAMSSASKLYRLKNVGRMELLNEMLLLMYASTTEINCTDAFLHTIRFYSFAEELYQTGFGEVDWSSLFQTLLSIGSEMCKVPQATSRGKIKLATRDVVGLHHLLCLVLRKIEECVKINLTLSSCDHLIKKIDEFPKLDTRCEPVRWLISENVKLLQPSCSA